MSQNSYERILMKCCGEVRVAQGEIDFDGDPNSLVDPGSFSTILYH